MPAPLSPRKGCPCRQLRTAPVSRAFSTRGDRPQFCRLHRLGRWVTSAPGNGYLSRLHHEQNSAATRRHLPPKPTGYGRYGSDRLRPWKCLQHFILGPLWRLGPTVAIPGCVACISVRVQLLLVLRLNGVLDQLLCEAFRTFSSLEAACSTSSRSPSPRRSSKASGQSAMAWRSAAVRSAEVITVGAATVVVLSCAACEDTCTGATHWLCRRFQRSAFMELFCAGGAKPEVVRASPFADGVSRAWSRRAGPSWLVSAFQQGGTLFPS